MRGRAACAGRAAALHSVSVLNVLRAQALRDTDFHAPSDVLAALNYCLSPKTYRVNHSAARPVQ
ncbi:MAG: hypothetical protein IH820_05770 [Bacteroidetes bacterium]|nr:hypothetical protein [Bacteroidota bacterium]